VVPPVILTSAQRPHVLDLGPSLDGLALFTAGWKLHCASAERAASSSVVNPLFFITFESFTLPFSLTRKPSVTLPS